jgi:6-phosphogluconolactonase (cycloisomerase 2 family)
VKTAGRLLLLIAAIGIVGCHLNGKYSVGGSVAGLSGSGLVLQDNAGNNLTVSGNGSFVFTSSIATGNPYAVTVLTQPSNPSQTCSVKNGAGTVAKVNITTVLVSCTQAGRVAFVANQSSNTILAYKINTSGLLVPATTPTINATGTGPAAMAIDSSGNYLLVANNGSGTLSVYSININTALLTPLTTANTGSQPVAVAIDPTNTYVYVANSGGSSISAYTINNTAGTLTELINSPFQNLVLAPSALAFDLAGDNLYVTESSSGDVKVLSIDSASGNLSANAGAGAATGADPVSIVTNAAGTNAFVAANTGNSLSSFTINASTGALSASGSSLPTGFGPTSLAVDAAGKFLIATNSTNANEVAAYAITPVTGALSLQGVATGTTPVSVAFDPSVVASPATEFVYVVNQGSNTVSVYSLGIASGHLTEVTGSPISAGTSPNAIVLY